MDRKRWAVVGVAVLAFGWALWPRKPPSDEALIRAVLQDMADQAGQKRLSGLMAHVSEHYKGEGGSRDELKGYLTAYMLQSEWVSAVETHVEVTVDKDTAQTSMVVLMIRGPVKSASEIKPELIAGSHRIETKLVREDEWRVVSASRKEVSPAELLP